METNVNMTAERSLEIITQMVDQTRRRVEETFWQSMLWWGIVTAVLAIVVVILWQHTPLKAWANVLWAVEALAALAVCLKRWNQTPETYLMKTVRDWWRLIGALCCLVAFGVGFATGFDGVFEFVEDHIVYIPIVGIVILFTSLGSVITGSLIRNRVIMVCGCLTAVIGGTLALSRYGYEQMYIMAGSAVLEFVIPALVIRYRKLRLNKVEKPC